MEERPFPPSPEVPTVKLFGKGGGDNDCRQLDITAQVELEMCVDGKIAKVPVLGYMNLFIHMPFGMCNAPATFQRLMQVRLYWMASNGSFALCTWIDFFAVLQYI